MTMKKSIGISKLNILTIAIAAIALTLVAPNAKVYAHEGEDHGEKKAPVVSTSANMIVRVARAGDLEVMIKHPPVEPDKETTARVFVTRFETNEPVEGAKIVVVIAGVAHPVEATAGAGSNPGLYDVKLPPVPEGQYELAARVEAGGVPHTVEYGALQVQALPPPASAGSSSWARTALVALGLLLGLGFAAAVIYRAAALARRGRIKGEAATA